MKPHTPRRLENTTRRTLEWIFLILAMIVGLGVVGGCGAIGIATGGGGAAEIAALVGGIIMLIGLVYLATSMSRDVRLLKQALLEKDQRLSEGDPEPPGGYVS